MTPLSNPVMGEGRGVFSLWERISTNVSGNMHMALKGRVGFPFASLSKQFSSGIP